MSDIEREHYSVEFIAKYIDAKVVGDPNLIISRLDTLESASNGSITFLAKSKYKKLLDKTDASAVIVKDGTSLNETKTFLVCKDPYLAYAKLSNLFCEVENFTDGIVKNNSFIHKTARLGRNIKIGPNVYIGQNCSISDNSIIYPNSTIMKDVSIGEDCKIHSNSVLGSDGFGFAQNGKKFEKIKQIGGLKIGNNVEVGAGCTIDRGAISDTCIGDGVILDNQIHIAHNVNLGENSAIAACCAIAGSSKIGKNFKMGGLSGVLGHLEICDDVSVGAHTLITKNIKNPGNYIGIMPAQNHVNWSKSAVFIKKRGK